MLIMGIDPGTVNLGVGIIEKEGSKLNPIFYDVLKMSSKTSIPDRIGEIFAYITGVLQKYDVRAVAIEDIFTSVNYRSALKLGQARGAAIAAAKNMNIPVYEYTPKNVKQSVCGYGGAAKEQVKQLVEILLGIKINGLYDITDALAIAISHANANNLQGVINDRIS